MSSLFFLASVKPCRAQLGPGSLMLVTWFYVRTQMRDAVVFFCFRLSGWLQNAWRNWLKWFFQCKNLHAYINLMELQLGKNQDTRKHAGDEPQGKIFQCSLSSFVFYDCEIWSYLLRVLKKFYFFEYAYELKRTVVKINLITNKTYHRWKLRMTLYEISHFCLFDFPGFAITS